MGWIYRCVSLSSLFRIASIFPPSLSLTRRCTFFLSPTGDSPLFFLLSPRSLDCPTTIRARELSTSSPAPCPSCHLSPGDKPSHESRKPTSLSRACTLSFTAVGARAHAAYLLSPSSKPLLLSCARLTWSYPHLVSYRITCARTHTPSPGSLGANHHPSLFPPSHDHPKLAKCGRSVLRSADCPLTFSLIFLTLPLIFRTFPLYHYPRTVP